MDCYIGKLLISCVLIKELDAYTIASAKTTYNMKIDLTSCTCKFFLDFGLPCRHIISFHLKNNIEIPIGLFRDHWRNECQEVYKLIFFMVSLY